MNLPDVFGTITSAAPNLTGPIQAAVAIRPPTVHPGQRFDVIVLLQNIADAPVEVALMLHVPDKSGGGKKGHFRAEKTQVALRLEAAEVGYAALPLMAAPDVTPGSNYSVGVEINTKTQAQKPERMRSGEQPAPFDPASVSTLQQQEITQLRKLGFSSKTRGGILRGKVLEAPFDIQPGKAAEANKTRSGWVSLWTLGDLQDVTALLSRCAELMRLRFVPRLRRTEAFQPLLQKTTERFEQAGYPLLPFEANAITRLLTLILEYANISATAQNIVEAGTFYIEPLMSGKLPNDGEALTLPNWTAVMLRQVARDARVAAAPGKAIAHFAYDALLRDAIMHGFFEVERATGEDLGTEDEMHAYTQSWMERFAQRGQMNFNYVYMPLVLGGIIVQDRLLLPDEKLPDVLNNLKDLLDHRLDEQTEENALIFELSERVVTQALRKYGSLDSRNR